MQVSEGRRQAPQELSTGIELAIVPVSTIDTVAEPAFGFVHRSERKRQEARKIARIDSSKPLDDVLRRTGSRFEDLFAKVEVAIGWAHPNQAVYLLLQLSCELPDDELGLDLGRKHAPSGRTFGASWIAVELRLLPARH